MLKHMKVSSLTVIMLIGAVMITMSALYAHRVSSFVQQAEESEAELPLADYNAPDSSDPSKRTKRKIIGEKYNKAPVPVEPSKVEETRTDITHWDEGLGPLPAAKSDVIVIGDVVKAEAHLSPDKTAVYSEYEVRVDEVLKSADASVISQSFISVERLGARVKSPSGKIQTYRVAGQGVPRTGRRYALFLKRVNQDLQIITGYELKANKVKPLDNSKVFSEYDNADVQGFLSELRQAIHTENPPTTANMRDPGGEPPEPTDPVPCVTPTPPACQNPPFLNAAAGHYKPNAKVQVTINPAGFNEYQIKAMIAGFRALNAINGSTGINSGVVFEGFLPLDHRPDRTNDTPDRPSLHVEGHAEVLGNDGVIARGATTYYSQGSPPNSFTTGSIIRIDTDIPVKYTGWCSNGGTFQYDAMSPLIQHETAHTYGLADCYPQCNGASIMRHLDNRVPSLTLAI